MVKFCFAQNGFRHHASGYGFGSWLRAPGWSLETNKPRHSGRRKTGIVDPRLSSPTQRQQQIFWIPSETLTTPQSENNGCAVLNVPAQK